MRGTTASDEKTVPRSRALLRSAAVAVAALLAASSAPSPAAAAAPLRTVSVATIDGAPVSGPFAGATAAGVRLEGRETSIALDGVREIAFPAPAEPTPAPRPDEVRLRVVLRGGERVIGRLVSGSEAGLELEPAGVPALQIPFDALVRIEAEPPDRDPCADPNRLLPRRVGTDLAYSRSGDQFAGTLTSADKSGVTLEQGGEKRRISWSDLVILHVDEPPLPPADGLETEIETFGGTRLTTTDWKSDGASFTLKSRAGVAASVPVGSVSKVRLRGSRFVYASDLPWTYEHHSTNTDDWKKEWYVARADLTLYGCPLRIRSVPYRHGVYAHATSALRVPLGKRYARFECQFGVDDTGVEGSTDHSNPSNLDVKESGEVTARVLADGKEVWTSGGLVKGGEAARTIGPIDVTGVDVLTLEVGAAGSDMSDRVDWADPILVKAK